MKTVLWYLGDSAELADVTRELEPRLRHAKATWLLQWCVFDSSFVQLSMGDWTAARQRIRDAIEINSQTGFPAYEGFFMAHRGWVARLDDDLSGALADGKLVVEKTGGTRHPWWYPTAAGYYAGSLLAAGRPDEAAEVAADGAACAGDAGPEAYLLRCQAPLVLATGSDDILASADRLLGSTSTPPGGAWIIGADAYLMVARAWLDRGERARARHVLAPLLTATSPTHWPAVHRQVQALHRLTAARPGGSRP